HRVHDLVRARGGDLERRLIQRLRPDQRLADEVPAALRAHLARLRQPHVDDLAVARRPDLAQQEVAVVAEPWVLAAEESEHDGILARDADRHGAPGARASPRASGGLMIDLERLLENAFRAAVAAAAPET